MDGPGPVAAAPWGSAGILPISWAYIALMGPDGLRRATEVAILNANYVATRLKDHFPVLYTGDGGLVAHECILDLRGLTKDTGVTAEDVAKRLIDYGFHAPTLSFPVAGTLMVEPTESESQAELDRFCDAMIAIRAEIDRVAAGEWPVEDSPLRHAPHTAEDVVADDWSRPYSRETAAYPVASLRPEQVLGAGGSHRPGLRRPQPAVRVPARRGLCRRVGPWPRWSWPTVLLTACGGDDGGGDADSPSTETTTLDPGVTFDEDVTVPSSGAPGGTTTVTTQPRGRRPRSARCPPAFPESFPVPEGAEVEVGSVGQAEGELRLAVDYTIADEDPAAVHDFYRDAIAEAGFTVLLDSDDGRRADYIGQMVFETDTYIGNVLVSGDGGDGVLLTLTATVPDYES